MAMIRSRHAEKPPEHEKHVRSNLVLHPEIPVHIPLGLAGMTSAKNPDITRYAVIFKCMPSGFADNPWAVTKYT